MRRSLAASGPLRPDAVWERYADLRRWSSWAPQIRRVEAQGHRLEPGLLGRVHGLGVSAGFEVLAVDEQRRNWSWRVRSGPVTLRLRHAVDAHADGSRTTLDVDGPAPVVLAYLPVAQLALARLVRP